MGVSPSWRSRLKRPVFLWSLAALVAEVIVQWQRVEATWWGLLPLVCMVFFTISLVRIIGKMDELQQRICQESGFRAFVLTFVLTLLLFGVERMGIARPHWNDLGEYMLALWGCAYALTAWRYR